MKLRRKIYEGLIAQCEALAAALHEEKSKRQLWTRKYYTLLLGIESARREAGEGGMDAAATRFGSDVNGTGCSCETCWEANHPYEFCRPFITCSQCGNKRCPKATYHANACTNSNAVGQPGSSWAHVKPHTPPGYDPDGFYTSHSLNTLEAFGALPCRTVANAYCDAPPTVALTTDLTRPEPLGGDVGFGIPAPSAEPVRNALSRNAQRPLSTDTSINSAV